MTAQVTGQVLHFCQEPRKAGEIQELLGLRHRENFQNNYLKPLLDKGWLERTIPDKPRSRMQRYRTAKAGLAALKGNKMVKSTPMRRGTLRNRDGDSPREGGKDNGET